MLHASISDNDCCACLGLRPGLDCLCVWLCPAICAHRLWLQSVGKTCAHDRARAAVCLRQVAPVPARTAPERFNGALPASTLFVRSGTIYRNAIESPKHLLAAVSAKCRSIASLLRRDCNTLITKCVAGPFADGAFFEAPRRKENVYAIKRNFNATIILNIWACRKNLHVDCHINAVRRKYKCLRRAPYTGLLVAGLKHRSYRHEGVSQDIAMHTWAGYTRSEAFLGSRQFTITQQNVSYNGTPEMRDKKPNAIA